MELLSQLYLNFACWLFPVIGRQPWWLRLLLYGIVCSDAFPCHGDRLGDRTHKCLELLCPPSWPLNSRVFFGWDIPSAVMHYKMHLSYIHCRQPTVLLSFLSPQGPRATSLMQRLELSKLVTPMSAHTPLTEVLLGSQYLFIYCAMRKGGSS